MISKVITPHFLLSEFIRSKSGAAAGLCAWVINIIKFFEVFCDVEPKRKALAAANAELAAATEKLKSIKSKVAVSVPLELSLCNYHSHNLQNYEEFYPRTFNSTPSQRN